jgi:Xaa-Pro aminopeptidase
VLLLGVSDRARNLPMNRLPFRQDSTLLYFGGCALPDTALFVDGERAILYRPRQDSRDVLWHGAQPTWTELARRHGADEVRDIERLESDARALRPATLAVADEAVNQRASAWLGTPLRFGVDIGDEALAAAVIALRRTKSAEEIAALRRAGDITGFAHRAAMAATRPGGHERVLAALFEGVLAAAGCVPGYGTILTQSGEVLHHHGHGDPLEAGRLVLLDGGAEGPDGYGADVTRAWPVSGRFTSRQRTAYDAVLDAQRLAIERCRPGVRYREVHDVAARRLASFLVDEGLLRCGVDEAFERQAHALFFPHGTGHLIGLDVHDLENLGDRPAYAPGAVRDRHFGTGYLRLDLPLEAGWVVTVEPGFYVVPSIFEDAELMAEFGDLVDRDRVAPWIGFGGIRIEDDVAIGVDGPDVLTSTAPKAPGDVEALVGTGPMAEHVLCGV